MKKKFSPQLKATVALEAVKGVKTTTEIASVHSVHPTQINGWRKHLVKEAAALFTDKRAKEGKTEERRVDDLYKINGQRDVELEWLKKSLERFNA